MMLLTGQSLTPERRVPLESMSLQLNERESTAVMVPADADGISVGAWLKDDTEPGKGIVWRVKSISNSLGARTVKISLEHAVSLLKDRILFGEITPATITGNKNAQTCTALQAVNYILGQQSDWVLGTFGFGNVTNAYKFDGDNLFDALEQVSDTLEDCVWEYDMGAYPFTISLKKKSSAVGTVMRAGRNITAITKSIDRGGMITRFYPIGKDDLELPEKFIEKNTALYGVSAKVETDESIDTAEGLRKWAQEKLRKHAEPQVVIDVDGLELAEATGQALDKMRLGMKCLIPVSGFGAEIMETITQISYQDKIRQPKSVKITLANQRKDITKILADAMKKGGKGGRGAAKKQKEDNAWFEDTNEHVAMCAKGIVGVDAKGEPNWVRLTQLTVNGDGLDSSVQSVQNGLVIAESRITQNEKEIKLEVSTRTKENKEMSSRIRQTESEISLTVKKDGVISAINQTAEQITIQAKHINLSGYVTMSEFKAETAKIDNLMTGKATATLIKSGSIQTETFRLKGSSITKMSKYIPEVGYINYLGYIT